MPPTAARTTHYYSPLLTSTHRYSLLTTHYSLLATRCSLLTTHYSLLTTYYLLLTTYYVLLTSTSTPPLLIKKLLH